MLLLSRHSALLLDDVAHALARSLIAVRAANRRNAAGGRYIAPGADGRYVVARAMRELDHVLVLAVGRGLVSETAARSIAGLAYDVAGQHGEA